MKRDPSIDIIRFIGLSLIILAHVDCPFTIRQIRMFDVPMMVFISGLSYSGKTIDSLGNFYRYRLKRLLIPVWTFIPVFLFPHAILEQLGLLDCGFTWSCFFGSFVFYKNAMGYIWIFKVFIIVMLATPFLIMFNSIIKKDIVYFFLIVTIIFLQQSLCIWFLGSSDFPGKDIVETYGLYLLGYFPMFMLGIRVRNSERKTEYLFASMMGIVMILTFIVFYQKDSFFVLSPYKYPPQFSYIVYGCFMSLVLWFIRKPLVRLLNNRVVLYVGQNSDWIYLWHAFFVLYVTRFIKPWYMQFIVIFILAGLVCMIQKRITSKSKFDFIKKYY